LSRFSIAPRQLLGVKPKGTGTPKGTSLIGRLPGTAGKTDRIAQPRRSAVSTIHTGFPRRRPRSSHWRTAGNCAAGMPRFYQKRPTSRQSGTDRIAGRFAGTRRGLHAETRWRGADKPRGLLFSSRSSRLRVSQSQSQQRRQARQRKHYPRVLPFVVPCAFCGCLVRKKATSGRRKPDDGPRRAEEHEEGRHPRVVVLRVLSPFVVSRSSRFPFVGFVVAL